MNNLDSTDHLSGKWHPLVSAFYLLLFTLLGFTVVGPLIGMLFAAPFYGGDIFSIQEALINPTQHPEIKIPLYIIQGFATFIGFILIPILYIKTFLKRDISFLSNSKYPSLFEWISIPIIVISFMVVNAWFIEWNEGIVFPEFFKSVEHWARQREDYLAEVTQFLTQFDNMGQFWLAVLVVAILPGIGEELVFRGLIQRHFYDAFRNAHIAIWLSAALFSAFHMQFFGFVPRMLLGALFGYLYYWSGSLWPAILAHIFNNGFSLLMIYLYQIGLVDFDIENTSAVPIIQVIVFSIITGVLLLYFKRQYKTVDGDLAKGV